MMRASLKGPFPVIVETSYGKGKIVVISDSSFLINSMIDLGDNLKLVNVLTDGRQAMLDTSHWKPNLHKNKKNSARLL